MNHSDIERQKKLLAMQARLLREEATIQGMIIANKERTLGGFAPVHSQDAFDKKAAGLEELTEKILNI